MAFNILTIWKRVTPPWRYALGVFVCTRVGLILWSYVVYSIFPVALQNLDLFGEPVLTAFYLKTSDRYAYSRMFDGTMLSFRTLDEQTMVDDQTGSTWSIQAGEAIQGKSDGAILNPSEYDVDGIFPYLGVKPADNLLLSLWQRFDANWYLMIAENGYRKLAGSTAYFPLYPILIHVFSFVVEPMMAAVLISNIALLFVLVTLYQLVSTSVDEGTTRRTLIYFLIFPTSFFFMTAYTEALFLLFATGSLYVASRRRWWQAVILGILSALTRLQGILLFIPLLYLLWNENKHLSLKEIFFRALPVAFIPAATLAFFIFSNFSMVGALESNWHARFVFPWENIWASMILVVSPAGTFIDFMNLSVTLGFAVVLLAVWNKLPVEYFLYSLFMLLTPLFRMNSTQPLVSMTRYVLIIFPVFIVFGIWGKNPWINRVILYISVPLQLYLSAQFILWGWVG